jgi:hypothetical protein
MTDWYVEKYFFFMLRKKIQYDLRSIELTKMIINSKAVSIQAGIDKMIGVFFEQFVGFIRFLIILIRMEH